MVVSNMGLQATAHVPIRLPTPRFQRGVDGLSFVTTAIHLTNGRKINPHSIFESSLKPITFEQKLN